MGLSCARTASRSASFCSYCETVSAKAAKKGESLSEPRSDWRSETCVVMSFQSLMSGVRRPFSSCSVSEKVVSCDQPATSWMASRMATSPSARALSVLSSSWCSTIASAAPRKWCRQSCASATFSMPSLWKSDRQCSGWNESPRTYLSAGATSRKRCSSALRWSATAPGGHAVAFSPQLATKSSKTHSRWRKEIQSSLASSSSSLE